MRHIKLFEEFQGEVIDLSNDYIKGNPITYKAKPGDRIKVERIDPGFNGDIPQLWLGGQVYLTEGDNDIAYHGGLIDQIADNIEDYIQKKGGLYLTRSLRGAWAWRGGVTTGGKPEITRVYEVKIKKGSLFLEDSPAAQDSDGGLRDERDLLTKIGIQGMADKNFRSNTHDRTNPGTTGSEGLILNSRSIASFRSIPFSELAENEDIKRSHLYDEFLRWYEGMKEALAWNLHKQSEEYERFKREGGYSGSDFADEDPWKDFLPTISKEIEEKFESLTTKELIELQSQVPTDWKNKWNYR